MSRTYFTMTDCNITEAEDIQAILGTDTLAVTLSNILILKYKYNWIIWEDNSDSPSDTKIDLWKTQLATLWRCIKDKYIVLSNALKQSPIQTTMTSTSSSKYNDTPQNAGAFEDEAFTSNYAHSTSTQDVDLMSKIAQINATYPKMMQELVEEFRVLYGGLCV